VNRIRGGMDLGYWRTHDFRRTLVTRLSEMNVEPHVTERMLVTCSPLISTPRC
ncbi:integrase, partial [Escherichia coli]